jgi:hypothetical protein
VRSDDCKDEYIFPVGMLLFTVGAEATGQNAYFLSGHCRRKKLYFPVGASPYPGGRNPTENYIPCRYGMFFCRPLPTGNFL